MTYQAERFPSTSKLALALLATFTITLGYGVILPAMPFYLQHLAEHGNVFSISRHTGVLTGIYSFSLFVFAPLWGKLSDRFGRRRILLLGLAGFSFGMVWFALAPNLLNAYLSRAIAGLGAAAVLPTTLAALVEITAMAQRARAVAAINAANALGFLAGPTLAGVWTTYPPSWPVSLAWLPVGFNALPMLASAGVGLATTIVVGVWWRDWPIVSGDGTQTQAGASVPALGATLLLTLFVTFALGSFEVGYTILAQQQWLLSEQQVALIFVACSVVMIIVQIFLFAPLLLRFGHVGLAVPALLVSAAGVALLPVTTQYASQMGLVSVIALGAGLAVPVLAYSVSLAAGQRQGTAFGRQIAVTSLGQALGAISAGVLFHRHAALTLWLAAALLVLGASYYLLRRPVRATALSSAASKT